MTQVFDGRKMCKSIARREFDRTRESLQPLLKLLKGCGLGRAPYHSADRITASATPQRAPDKPCGFTDDSLSRVPGWL